MADLIASVEEDCDAASVETLRLSIKWRSIFSDDHIGADLEAELSIGLFMGDRSLLADRIFENRHKANLSQEPGYFYGLSDRCELLHDLWHSLRTGECRVIEDVEGWFSLVVGKSIFCPLKPGPDGASLPSDDYFDVLAVILHGGPWHGPAMSCNGPALMMMVRRDEPEQFFYDLLDEALDPAVSNDMALTDLRKRFAEPLALRERPQT